MSKRTTFTSPGKIGDCLHQWPIAFWWHRQTGEPFDFWMDEGTCKPLVNLIQAQPGVQEVKLVGGIESYHCGGQPWHFGLDPSAHEDRHFVHLGFRAFPQRQLTLQTLHDVSLVLDVTPEQLAETPNLTAPEEPKQNRVILHGMGICPHTKQTPAFWKFLARIAPELAVDFESHVFVGSPDDREVARETYPEWQEFDDGGDFLKLASLMNASKLVIGCGSAPVALAQQLKVPCVRVHDNLGDASKVIWSGLGKNQINATEFELRTQWAEFQLAEVTL